MLDKLQNVLRHAQKYKYAVGAFNVSNLEQTQAVITAAHKMRSPVIVNTSEKAIAYAGLEEISVLVRTMAKKYRLPIVLNLDHGHNLAIVKKCLQVGYTGIMFEGSRRPYSKNLPQTAAAVTLGRRYGVGVEGEIGQVKYTREIAVDPKLVLSDPDQARQFVNKTKVCALAVAIGNAPGLPLTN